MKGQKSAGEPVTAKGILISLGAGLAVAAAVMAIGGIPEKGTEAFWRKLCDAFTVPGILMTCTGLLSLVSGHGAFDGITFPVRKAFGQIFSEEKRATMPKTYFDYVEMKRAKSRKRPNYMMFTGLGFLACAVILLVIYLSRFPG